MHAVGGVPLGPDPLGLVVQDSGVPFLVISHVNGDYLASLGRPFQADLLNPEKAELVSSEFLRPMRVGYPDEITDVQFQREKRGVERDDRTMLEILLGYVE